MRRWHGSSRGEPTGCGVARNRVATHHRRPMNDWIPPQIWASIALAAAFAPARYVVDYSRYAPSRRNVTQPQPDIRWRPRPRFLANLAVGIGLLAVSILIWTPTAERFAQSAAFAPTLLLLLGGFATAGVVRSPGNVRAERSTSALWVIPAVEWRSGTVAGRLWAPARHRPAATDASRGVCGAGKAARRHSGVQSPGRRA